MSTPCQLGPRQPGPRRPDETRRVAVDGHEVVSYDQLGCGASAFPASALSSAAWNAWTLC